MMKKSWGVAGAALCVVVVCCACGTQNVNTAPTEQDIVRDAADTDAGVGVTPAADADPDDPGAETAVASVDFDMGGVNGQVYTNTCFGLNITFPDEWYIAPAAELAADNGLSEKEFTNEKIVELIDKDGIPEILWAHNDDLADPQTVKISGISGVTGRVSDVGDQSVFEDSMKDFLISSGNNVIDSEVGTLRIGNNDHYWLIIEEIANGRNVVYGMFIYGEGEHKLMISVMGPDRETMEELTYRLFCGM